PQAVQPAVRVVQDETVRRRAARVDRLTAAVEVQRPGLHYAYKSQIRAKAGEAAGQAKGKDRRGRPKAVPPKAPPTRPSGADPLEAAQQVKALVDRYGASTVKGLADLFGKGQG